MGFKPVTAAVALAIGLLIWFVIPVPEGVASNVWLLLALFVATIAAIIGKAMPIGALSILAISLVSLTGVTSDKPAVAIADALSSFANPLIWLIGVAIMISRALIKTGLCARIGYVPMRPCVPSFGSESKLPAMARMIAPPRAVLLGVTGAIVSSDSASA